jgi:hypothetical protein
MRSSVVNLLINALHLLLHFTTIPIGGNVITLRPPSPLISVGTEKTDINPLTPIANSWIQKPQHPLRDDNQAD